jgi:hypothetical protein
MSAPHVRKPTVNGLALEPVLAALLEALQYQQRALHQFHDLLDVVQCSTNFGNASAAVLAHASYCCTVQGLLLQACYTSG